MPRIKRILLLLIGSTILAFGLYHIHSIGVITEGGILGLELLLYHWFHISPAVSGFALNVICYILGWKALGKPFLIRSAIACVGFSLSYSLFELQPPLFSSFVAHPFGAAIAGALFVGVGVGLCIRAGGAPSGDDALAMTICKKTSLTIEKVYLVSDLVILGLSLSYIPPAKILYSLITVILSGQIIGWIQRIRK